MSDAENIAIVRRFYAEVSDRQNLDLADTLVAPHFKNHTAPPGMQEGPEGIKALVRMLVAAFPDDRHDIEDIFAAGDRVAVRQRHHGTHDGPFLGLPPSGRHVSQAERSTSSVSRKAVWWSTGAAATISASCGSWARRRQRS